MRTEDFTQELVAATLPNVLIRLVGENWGGDDRLRAVRSLTRHMTALGARQKVQFT